MVFFMGRARPLTSSGEILLVQQDILVNAMLSNLWEQFGEGPFFFQHDYAPVHKARF